MGERLGGGDMLIQNRERLIQAKKKRQSQLKKWHQYDKQMEKDNTKQRRSRSVPLGACAIVDVPDGMRAVSFGASIVLLEAANREDYDEVSRLLSKGLSPDLANEDGLTALHQCCINNSVDICKLLLSHGANVNAKDKENWTPLHAAALCGHKEICKLLIDKGAHLLAINGEGNMPFDICENEDCLDIIETAMANRGVTQTMIEDTRLIPEKKMMQDVKQIGSVSPQLLECLDNQGASLMHIAAANGFAEVAEFLCIRPNLLTLPDKDGWLPIHIAACWGHLNIIELLVSYGADIDARTRNTGESVFDICEDDLLQEGLKRIKVEAEKHATGEFSDLRRKGSMNRRGRTSIRRTSAREKSLTSWREAKQEAEFRLSKELDGVNLENRPSLDVLDNEYSPIKIHSPDKFISDQEKRQTKPHPSPIPIPNSIHAPSPSLLLPSSPPPAAAAATTATHPTFEPVPRRAPRQPQPTQLQPSPPTATTTTTQSSKQNSINQSVASRPSTVTDSTLSQRSASRNNQRNPTPLGTPPRSSDGLLSGRDQSLPPPQPPPTTTASKTRPMASYSMTDPKNGSVSYNGRMNKPQQISVSPTSPTQTNSHRGKCCGIQ